MASGYGNTSDSLDVTVKAVPEHLLEYAVSNFVQTLNEAKNAKKLSAEIHTAEGQLPKFVLLLEGQPGKEIKLEIYKNATLYTTCSSKYTLTLLIDLKRSRLVNMPANLRNTIKSLNFSSVVHKDHHFKNHFS